MRIKKLFVRMLIAITVGLCAGVVMEFSSAWLVFPVFLIVGILAALFIELVIEVVRGSLKITREDLRKMTNPVLRILVATSIGLLAGMILEYAAIWVVFPWLLILGVFAGISIEITIEIVRYNRSMKKAFMEGKGLALESLPVSTADLIRQVIKKMRYRKEVRSEVMTELAAHFEDELKDCKTDEEKGRKARQLIDYFGDTALLAVLLRRAKKRCRPLWRTVVARTFQAVGALILFFIIYAVWFSTGKPTISVDYLALLNRLNKPEVRDEDNAWPHYEKAIELFVEPDQKILKLAGNRRKDFRKKLCFSDLSKNKQDMIRKWLKENQSNWDNLELSQKQLFGRCFNEGLVPLMYSAYFFRHSSERYEVFDEFIEDILKKIERQQPGTRPDRISKYEMMMEMEMMGGYVYDRRNQRDIKLDRDIALDSEIIALFGTYSQEELKKIASGIEAGVIKEWIDNPPVAAKSLFDYLWPFERKLIVKWVEDNEAAWREFVTGSSKSYCYREYQYGQGGEDRFLWEVGFSHFNIMKYLTRVGIWRSQINLQRGQIQKSIDDCLAFARAGTHWQGRGTITEQLVGLALGRIASDEILHILAAKTFSADQLKRLQNQLSRLHPQGYPAIDMEGEKVAFMDTIQRIFTDSGPGGGHLIPQKTGMFADMYDIKEVAEEIPIGKKIFENAALTSMCLLHARRDATIAAGKQIYKQTDMIVKMSPYQRHKRDLPSTEDVIMSKPRYRYAMLEYVIPAAERISELLYQGRSLHEAIVTILAIQRWRLEKGEYPINLNVLIEGGFQKELPLDPYSDKALIYKKTGDNFVLYSVGRNFEDDGGKIFEERGDVQKWGTRENGDAVFWPVVIPQTQK